MFLALAFPSTYLFWHTPAAQVTLRPFSPAGFQAAGNPGVTLVAPYSWCTSAAPASVAGMAVSGAAVPGGFRVHGSPYE